MATLVSTAMLRPPGGGLDPPYFSSQMMSYSSNDDKSKKSWGRNRSNGINLNPLASGHGISSNGLGPGGSSLSKSMKYAETWLYGTVRSQQSPVRPGVYLQYAEQPSPVLISASPNPVQNYAVVVCSCPEYLNGTKKGSTKKVSICKKCKGSRLPLGVPMNGTMRAQVVGGTVRGPQSQRTSGGTLRAGTMKLTSNKSRPTILSLTSPSQASDPYDLMRRTRLTTTHEQSSVGSQFSVSRSRAKSISPARNRSRRRSPSAENSKTRSKSVNRVKEIWYEDISNIDGDSGNRKSILECDVNPYDLMHKMKVDKLRSIKNDSTDDIFTDFENDETFTLKKLQQSLSKKTAKTSGAYSSVQAISGQRIRIFGESNSMSVKEDYVYDDVQVNDAHFGLAENRKSVKDVDTRNKTPVDTKSITSNENKSGSTSPRRPPRRNKTDTSEEESENDKKEIKQKPITKQSAVNNLSPFVANRSLNVTVSTADLTIKSILKKPRADRPVSSVSTPPPPSTPDRKLTGSHFYLPTPPPNTKSPHTSTTIALQRKKVQFLVENDNISTTSTEQKLIVDSSSVQIEQQVTTEVYVLDENTNSLFNTSSDFQESDIKSEDKNTLNTISQIGTNNNIQSSESNNISNVNTFDLHQNGNNNDTQNFQYTNNSLSLEKESQDKQKVLIQDVDSELAFDEESGSQEDTDNELPQFDKGSTLRRSPSERLSVNGSPEPPAFMDTMALRHRPSRTHSRQAFVSTQSLVEIVNVDKPARPKEKPPPPPPQAPIDQESKNSSTITIVAEGDIDEKQACTVVPIKHSNSFSNLRPMSNENTFNRRHTTDGIQTLNNLYNNNTNSVLVNGKNQQSTSLRIKPKDVRFSIDTLRKEPNYVKTRFVRDKQILEEVSAMIAFDVDDKASVQISTESPESSGIHKISITQNDEMENDSNAKDDSNRKTSIMISGDDCYSTVNVNNDAPLYQSSVTINDANSPAVMNVGNTVTISVYSESEETSSDTSSRHSNQIYINNSSYKTSPFSPNITSKKTLVVVDYETVNCDNSFADSVSSMSSASEDSSNNHGEDDSSSKTISSNESIQKKSSTLRGTRCHENVTDIGSTPEDISRLLRDPVEAVKRNLVPHVCGKAVSEDVEKDILNEVEIPIKSESEIKTLSRNSFVAKLLEDPMLGHLAEGLDKDLVAKLIENSLVRLKQSREIGEEKEDDNDEKMSRLIDASLLKLQEEKNCSRPYETFSIGQTDCPRNEKDEEQRTDSNESSNKNNECSQNETNGNNVCSAPYESMEYESGLMCAASDAEPLSDTYNASASELSTEEDNCTRNKFYQMLVDATLSEIEISNTMDDDHHYESIRLNADPIYEEIGEIPPPLPLNPPPSSLTLIDDDNKKLPTRSIFEGASKYDILSYLVDAKERGIVPEDSYTFNFNTTNDLCIEEDGENKPIDHQRQSSDLSSRVSNLSNGSDSGEDSSLIITNSENEKSTACKKSSAEIERNDSGVGSETSKCSRSRWQSHTIPPNSIVDNNTPIHLCEDCDGPVETQVTDSGVMYAPLVCRKCGKKRAERKEIITEIVETEEKYGRDLQIILEEFYQPMLVAGLLTQEQLSAIFLNTEELLENNQALAERLRDALEIALEQGDEDLLTVNIGKLMLESAPMLHAFSSYCVRQGSASMLLSSLEKEKELLRIFLKVSQMENTVLRRMNLNSFLMVPVQRVTKYPLLLSRLFKVTPPHLDGRDLLRQAQQKIEQHLTHMNSEAKDMTSLKLWRRISSGNGSGRRSSSEIDMINIKLRKMAVDVLEWNHDEARFAMEGKLLFTQPNDNNWRKGRTIKLTPINALLVTNGKPTSSYKPCENRGPQFPHNTGIREASLLLIREKGGRAALLRDPLFLDRCVVAADSDWDDYFELQEIVSKDTYIFKAEDGSRTKQWCQQLQYHSQGMGAWRKRRNALANIMINGMTRN